MHLGDAPVVAADEAEQDLGEEPPLLQAEPAHDAEIDRARAGPRRRRTGCPGACRRGRSRRGARGAGRTGSRVRPSATRSWPAASIAARSLRRMPSIHSMVSTSRAVSSQSGSGTRKSGSSRGVLRHLRERGGLEPQIHLDRDGARQRLDDLATGRRRRASGEQRSTSAAPRSAWPARSRGSARARRAAAPSRRPSRRRRRAACAAWWTCAIEAAATGSLNSTKSSSSGRPSAASTMRDAPRRAERAASGPAGARGRAPPRTPTMSGRVARNWPNFT